MAYASSSGEERVVKLNKGSSGLGFSIKGGKEHGLPIVISRIFEGGVADECGQLEVGHEIMEVNGESLEAATHAQAVQALKKAGSDVTLKVKLNLVLQGGLLNSSKDNLADTSKPTTKGVGDNVLPDGWEMAIDDATGRKYYLDHNSEITSWIDPRTKKTHKTNPLECSDSELPYGWEKAQEDDGTEYFIDHTTQTTSWVHPKKAAMQA